MSGRSAVNVWHDRAHGVATRDPADEVWNRAAMAGGGPDARRGDALLASALAVHNRAMSGGLLNAVEQATPEQLQAAEAGYRWLQLDAAAEVVATVRREVETGALDDDDRADALEVRTDEGHRGSPPRGGR